MAVLSTLADSLPDASAFLAASVGRPNMTATLEDWVARWHTSPLSKKLLLSLGTFSALYTARIAYQLIANKRFERRLLLSDGSRVPVAPGTKWYHKIFIGYFIRILTEAPSSVIWQERNLYSAELQGKPKVYLAHSFWGAPVLMVTDPKALYFIFSGRGYGFTKWEFTKRALVTLAGKGSMLVVDGEQHKVHRRLVNPLFNMSNLKRLVPYMEECLDELYGVLDKATVKGNVVDFQELSVALTLNVIGRTALDTEFDALNNTHSPLHSAYNHLLESFSISAFNVLQGFLPFLRYMPIKRNRDIAQARDVTRDQVTRIIQRIKTDGAQAASTSVPSLMRVLLENQKRQVVGEDGTDGKLTQDEIRDEALTFLVAGHETTSNALSMTLYFLAAYPDTQSALYSALVDMPDHASLDDLLKLEALHQVVNEGLRVHSPVFATNRIALADQHVPLSDGRTLFMPKGTMLVVPIQAMHYDPELFPNPHVFQPDRWKSLRLAGHDDADLTSPTTSGGSGSGVRRDVHPMQFLPFLAGSRACIGRNFALMELKLFLAGIVKRYRVRLPDEEHARVAGKGERPKVHYSITARPEVVRLVFERR